MNRNASYKTVRFLPGRRDTGGFVSILRSPAAFVLAIYASIAAILLFFVFPAAAGAYTVRQAGGEVSGKVSVSPGKFELTLEPGEVSDHEVTVTNSTGDGISLDFIMEDFEGSTDPNQAVVYLGDEVSALGASDWIVPEIDNIFLAQGESITMNVEISVPEDTSPGGRYTAFSVSPSEGTANGAGANGAPGTVRTLFLLRVAGDASETASLQAPEAPGLFNSGRAQIGLVFKNEGNVHLKPSGKITITNLLGQEVAALDVPEWVVLPESSRRTLVEWQLGPLSFGRYTAQAQINYGSDLSQVTASSSFWLFPWDTLIIIVAFLAAVLIAIMLLRRRSRRARQAGGDQAEAEAAGLEPAPEEAAVEAAATPAPEPEVPAGMLAPEATQPQAEAAPEATLPVPEKDFVALSELFPSMDDSRLIDLNDSETQSIVRELVSDQIELGRLQLLEGTKELGRETLQEARIAASRARLYSVVGEIDDLLWQI